MDEETEVLIEGEQLFVFGHYETVGPRNKMEDATTIIGEVLGKGTQYYAVFDGHGGNKVSKYASNNLYKEIQKRFVNEEKLEETIKESFIALNKNINESIDEGGSTAAVVLIYNNIIYSANMGDARTVLSDADGKVTRLSRDHRATDPVEKAQIEKNGGKVFKDRVFGILMISRTLGDCEFDGVLINEPHISKTPIQSGMKLVIACDGVFDVLKDEEVMEIARAEEDPKKAAENIVDKALEKKTDDNVSCIVINI